LIINEYIYIIIIYIYKWEYVWTRTIMINYLIMIAN